MAFSGAASTPAAQKDIERIVAMWTDCRAAAASLGPFLFGGFSAADCMYAPVVTRFVTYAVRVDDGTRAYMDAVLAQPGMRAWCADAEAEVPAG